jgi:predicted MPP superfamily phosphohydrolase
LKKLFGSGLCAVLIAGAVLFAGCINFFSVRPTEYEILTEKELRAEGYRVVLIADVHYGVSLDYDDLLEKCAEISATEPDVVVLCGDIVDNSTTAEGMREVFRAFGTIESEFGIYYAYGNHDRSMKMLSNRFGDNELEKTITENGIKILRDEVTLINGELSLVGREDRSRNRLPIDELQKNIDGNNFVLVLDHQPSDYTANANSKTDLVLSGHTHGGQFFPIDILQKIIPFNDGVYGMYDLDDDTKAIVTSGFAGWAYPSKTSAPSEYVIIDIKSK